MVQAIDRYAREQAQKQWNANPCEGRMGDRSSLDYFMEVERERYRTQDWVLDYFPFGSYRNRKVLEIGVGQGTDLVQFAKGGAECHGIDITEEHLALTQRNFALRGYTATLKSCDATDIEYPDGYFDCVYSFGVIHHIPEAEKVFDEIHRVLKPGGNLYVSLYHKWSAFHFFIKLLCHGIVFQQLFKLGYRGLLATVESGADGRTIKPYVKTYGKAEFRRLLSGFSVDDLTVHQLSAEHFWPSVLGRALTSKVGALERYFGWYVVCSAVKL